MKESAASESRQFARRTLEQLGINPELLNAYDEPHRYYHNWSHIEELLTMANDRDILSQDLFLAILFHDLVYDPRASDNEKRSAELFVTNYSGAGRDEIAKAIRDTEHHRPGSVLAEQLCALDLAVLEGDLAQLIKYERKIFKEFQFVDWKDYKEKRLEFLLRHTKYPNLQYLAGYLEVHTPFIGVYPGSFNPFHIGHLNILQRAEKIFDKVIIARGINPGKPKPEFAMPGALRFHQLAEYGGLLTDFVKDLGYEVTIIRGLRGSDDLNYETNQYRYMQDLDPSIRVVSIICDREFEYLSSTGIRQLMQYENAERYLVR